MNILDRAVAWIDPVAGARRVRARTAIDMIGKAQRAYDGAKHGRRTEGWFAPGTSANAEIGPAGAALRTRARDLERNNPYGARIIDIWATYLVGTGIVPRSRTGNKRLDKQIDRLFDEWTRQSDADGLTDFYGQQQLAARSMVRDGEVLARLRDRRPSDALPVPFQLQLLESDFFDASRDTLGTTANGGRIALGIEFSPIGGRSAYWLYQQHPGDSTGLTGLKNSVRIDAADVAHLFRAQRPGQIRGASWLAPVMMRLRDLDDFQDAALMKAKIEACFGVAVTRADPENAAGPTKTDASGRRLETVSPGMILYSEPGEDVKTIAPSGTASAFDPFTIGGLMATAVGVGLTYHLISGDLRQANYSSLRAGNIPTNLGIEQIQWHTIIPQFCSPVWARFIRNGKLSGAIKDERAGPVEWIPPAIPANDPLKDLEADLLAVRTGRLTWPKFVSAWGFDPREQLAEIAEWNKAFDAAEVTLETDPRKVTRTGVTQGGTNNAATPPEARTGVTQGGTNNAATPPEARTAVTQGGTNNAATPPEA